MLSPLSQTGEVPVEARETREIPASSVPQCCRVVAATVVLDVASCSSLVGNDGLIQHSLLLVAGLGLGDRDCACDPRYVLNELPSRVPRGAERCMPFGETSRPCSPVGETAAEPGCSVFRGSQG